MLSQLAIDSLDIHKKGNSHLNMQARESIRFLDQTLKKDGGGERSLTTSFLRTQKLSEKLPEWSDAEKYWLGESRNNDTFTDDSFSQQGSEDEDDEGDGLVDVIENSDIESVSSEDLFRPRRRQFDEDEEEDEDSEISISDTEDSKEEYDSQESEGEDEQKVPSVSFTDVPRAYSPLISCMLYYMTHQDAETSKQQNILQLVLVTNDEKLAYWASMFGDPATGKRLCIKTTEEWDHIVRTRRLLVES